MKGIPTGSVSRFVQNCEQRQLASGHVCQSAWITSASTERIIIIIIIIIII
jgi:hypothetical protein